MANFITARSRVKLLLTLCKVKQVIENTAKSINLQLIDGEERKFSLELENTSKLPVKWVEITCTPKEPKPAAQLTLNFGDVCQTIAPGAKMIIGGSSYVQLSPGFKQAKSVYNVDIRYKGKF